MKNIKSLIGALVCLGFAGHANAASVDLGGVGVDGGSTVVINVDVGPGVVAGVNFDFTYTPSSPSWSSELEISIQAPTGETFVACSELQCTAADIELGGLDNSDPLVYAGSSALWNGLSSGGTWVITLSENFDDALVNPDGIFDAGSSIEIKTNPIPVPAAVWLFGSALAGLGFARRKMV